LLILRQRRLRFAQRRSRRFCSQSARLPGRQRRLSRGLPHIQLIVVQALSWPLGYVPSRDLEVILLPDILLSIGSQPTVIPESVRQLTKWPTFPREKMHVIARRVQRTSHDGHRQRPRNISGRVVSCNRLAVAASRRLERAACFSGSPSRLC
jgi:hypothetical protein